MARRAALLSSLLALTLSFAPSAARAGVEPQTSEIPTADQGSSFHFRSYIRSVEPQLPGLSFQVLEFADRLKLVNHTGKTVTVYGYQSEPYARVLANGTAEVNLRSPAAYLNRSFYGNIEVPAQADPKAAPQWSVIARTGSFEWHDHRIHWASPQLPPEVKDKAKRTLIFDWTVPVAVGSQKGAVAGQLFWVPQKSKASTPVIIIGIAIVVAGLAFVLFVRRRRSRSAATDARSANGHDPRREAW